MEIIGVGVLVSVCLEDRKEGKEGRAWFTQWGCREASLGLLCEFEDWKEGEGGGEPFYGHVSPEKAQEAPHAQNVKAGYTNLSENTQQRKATCTK